MVFVIHWHESAMDLHVFPIPIPPPTSLSTRSLWEDPVHQVWALVSCIQPGLVICFTVDNIHVSMLFCELSFIWGRMKTVVWETAPQIALRNCSKEAGGTDSIYEILVNGEYMQSRTYFFCRNFCSSCEASASQEKYSSPWRILVLF